VARRLQAGDSLHQFMTPHIALVHTRPSLGVGTGTVTRPAAQVRRDRIGLYVALLLAYPFFEYGRPENPMRIPMLCSCILFGAWLWLPNKKWHPQLGYFFALVVVMCTGILMAMNTPSAVWHTYGLLVTLVGTCIPLMAFVNSVRRITAFVHALLAAFLYVALYAITHNGVGPGWQDENYAATAMSMALPFAYFSIFITRRTIVRVLYATLAGAFMVAVVVSFSRGGFLGLGAALIYCWMRSPRGWPAYLIPSALVLTLVVAATPAYWTEMQSITDMREATIQYRFDLWQIAYRMFEDYPLTGVGPGNFVWNAGDYQSAEQFERYRRSLAASSVTHSLYFELLAELGLAGFSIFLAMLYRNWKDLRFVARVTHDGAGEMQRLACYERAIAGSFVGVLVSGASVSLLYYSHVWLLTAMAVALKEITKRRRSADLCPAKA
jgi:O-antigen ligase/polysaccharide polymerase Wzy-like membrane protein